MTDLVIELADPTAVAHARREVVALTRPLEWNETAASNLGLAVTEAATNVLKHAGRGTMLARRIVRDPADAVAAETPGRSFAVHGAASVVGIEVIALDQGPGIADVARSLRDGHSSAGTPGLGLGSMRRLAQRFDIWSQPGRGTVLRFEAWPDVRASAERPSDRMVQARLEVGVVCVPLPGETACGDAWAVHATSGQHVAMVVDGLGHGPEAASAAHAARRALALHPELPPRDQVASLHQALRPTRGGAASVATLDLGRETGSFCGVGNVSGVVRSPGKSRSLVSHNGTLGHQLRKVQAFDFPFPYDALLVLHSDGIATSWRFDDYPGIEARHPALIAAVLYRDHRRSADDATVLVARNRQRRA